MFATISANSDLRITETRSFLDFLDTHSPALPAATPRHINSGKGLVYVQLYGAIEYTITRTIAESIDHLNGDGLTLNQLKPILMSLALDRSFESLAAANRKKWEKRHDLLKLVEDDIAVNISETLMPTDGRNIRLYQLQSIWKIFCIPDPIFYDVTFQSRLNDIVENRNLIAHGNEAPYQIGARVSSADLYDRIEDVSTFCTYFLIVFEEYLTKKTYLK